MRTVGLDVGDRRIGVAVSDATGLIASAVGNIVRSDDDYEGDLKKTAAEIERLNGEQIVIGLPKNMNGTIGPRAQAIQQFAEDLKKYTSLPIAFWDERLTTVAAEKMMIQAGVRRDKRKKNVDRIAATFILQDFLDLADAERK